MPLERGDALLLLAQQGAGGLAEILDGERELERPGRAHAVELGLEKLHQRIGDRLARRAVGQGRGQGPLRDGRRLATLMPASRRPLSLKNRSRQGCGGAGSNSHKTANSREKRQDRGKSINGAIHFAGAPVATGDCASPSKTRAYRVVWGGRPGSRQHRNRVFFPPALRGAPPPPRR